MHHKFNEKATTSKRNLQMEFFSLGLPEAGHPSVGWRHPPGPSFLQLKGLWQQTKIRVRNTQGFFTQILQNTWQLLRPDFESRFFAASARGEAVLQRAKWSTRANLPSQSDYYKEFSSETLTWLFCANSIKNWQPPKQTFEWSFCFVACASNPDVFHSLHQGPVSNNRKQLWARTFLMGNLKM